MRIFYLYFIILSSFHHYNSVKIQLQMNLISKVTVNRKWLLSNDEWAISKHQIKFLILITFTPFNSLCSVKWLWHWLPSECFHIVLYDINKFYFFKFFLGVTVEYVKLKWITCETFLHEKIKKHIALLMHAVITTDILHKSSLKHFEIM